MMRLYIPQFIQLFRHNYRYSQPPKPHGIRNFKVAVIGASGGIGQPLSLLLKINPLITELALYDVKGVKGVGADLDHVNTKCKITAWEKDYLPMALICADVVVISAGFARKPNMTRADLFDKNAGLIKNLFNAMAKDCPKYTLYAIITNPVNALVPLAAQVLKNAKKYDERRLFGVTTLDVLRATTFIADHMNLDPKDITMPVIGGHCQETMLPLFSQCQPAFKGDYDCVMQLTKRIRTAGTDVIKAKKGTGSATLSMAVAGARFTNALLVGLTGKKQPPVCTYVASKASKAKFLATPVTLGKKGVIKNHGLGSLCSYEQEMFDKLLPILRASIKLGIKFANKKTKK